jgi:hypothetical protein
MKVNYLTMGGECSPAAALRNLNLREFALPFDWIVSGIDSLNNCFEDNFVRFHKNLHFNSTKSRLIDEYGFQFPHDYPLNTMKEVESDSIGEGVFGEESGKIICDTWKEYHDAVVCKYTRRIERFKLIINDMKPIVVLCRYNINDVLKLQQLFIKHYNRDDIYFINSTNEVFKNEKIRNIYTEKNGIWNDSTIWKEGIERTLQEVEIKK